MKTYEYDEHYGQLNTYRDNDKLFLSERLPHTEETKNQISKSIAKQQIDACYQFHNLKGADLPDSFLDGFSAGKEYLAIGLESLLEDLSIDCTSVTLTAGPTPVLTLDQLDDDNVVVFPPE